MIRTTFIFSVFFSCFFWVRNAHVRQEQVYDSPETQTFGFFEMKECKASAGKFAGAFAFAHLD